jgi:hypothetical protein
MKSIEHSRKKAQQKYDLLAAINEVDEENPNEEKVVEIELNPIAYKSSEAARQTTNVEVREALSGTASVVHMRLPSERLTKPKEEALP